jgi:hypothetical protein
VSKILRVKPTAVLFCAFKLIEDDCILKAAECTAAGGGGSERKKIIYGENALHKLLIKEIKINN